MTKKWRKLDNTAKIFSLDERKNTNIFRYSVILKHSVDKELLQTAVKKALKVYSAFKVKMKAGWFWNYLEYNPKDPIVIKDSKLACENINYKENNDYLFKVTYTKNKINLDIFHVLTDGTGAISFFKSIIYNYLDVKNRLPYNKPEEKQLDCQDLYLKHYNKKTKEKMNFKGAYLISEKIKRNTNNTYHYTMDVNEIKKICERYNVTITEYLTALYSYALYLALHKKKVTKEIVITVPVNLRKYYKEDTLANFFVCMNVNPKIIEKKLNNFTDILKEVNNEFKEKLPIEKIKKYLSRDVNLGENTFIKIVPLFIKKIFIKYTGKLFYKSVTSTLSNVGVIDIEDQYKKYIDNILVMVLPGKIQKIKCTVCSFDNKLNVTMNSNIADEKFEKVFYNLLQQHINNIKLESNVAVNY